MGLAVHPILHLRGTRPSTVEEGTVLIENGTGLLPPKM